MYRLFFLLSLISLSSYATDKVPMLTGKLYVPQGYDTNDMVEVVIMGRLPDLCHRNPTYEIKRTGNTFSISLYAYYVPQKNCKKVSYPYMETVSLGMLPQGKFTVELRSFIQIQDSSPLQIAKANSSLQDEFHYGNVMGLQEEEEGRTITLIGTNPINCLKFEKLEATVQGKIIVLSPHFRTQGKCEEVATPFTIKYEVPYLSNSPQGILLHVRVMDGRSYNYFYQNKL